MFLTKKRIAAIAALWLAAGIPSVSLAFPFPYDLRLQARANATGSSTFNLPAGATIFDHTPDLSNARHVAARISTDSANFRQGIFLGQSAMGGIVYNGPNDTFLSDPSVNEAGRVVYRVDGGGIRSFDRTTNLESLYTTGLPGTTQWESPRINNLGQVSFRSTSGTGRAADLYSPQSNMTVRFVSDPTLDPASPFQFVFTPSSNNLGHLAVKLQRGPSTSADEIHLFTPAGPNTLVAAETGSVPSSPFSSLDNSVNVNDMRQVVFAGSLAANSQRGIFVGDLFNPPRTMVVQSPGFTIPFFTPDINNAGLVVFRAEESSVPGIYVTDGTTLQRVAFVGQSVMTDLGMTTISNFSQNPRINEQGDVVFLAGLASGGRGLFLATVPEPGLISIFVFVAFVGWRRHRAV